MNYVERIIHLTNYFSNKISINLSDNIDEQLNHNLNEFSLFLFFFSNAVSSKWRIVPLESISNDSVHTNHNRYKAVERPLINSKHRTSKCDDDLIEILVPDFNGWELANLLNLTKSIKLCFEICSRKSSTLNTWIYIHINVLVQT